TATLRACKECSSSSIKTNGLRERSARRRSCVRSAWNVASAMTSSRPAGTCPIRASTLRPDASDGDDSRGEIFHPLLAISGDHSLQNSLRRNRAVLLRANRRCWLNAQAVNFERYRPAQQRYRYHDPVVPFELK